MRSILLIAFFLVGVSVAKSQPHFQKELLLTSGALTVNATTVISDGSVLYCGCTSPRPDGFIMMIDAAGSPQWAYRITDAGTIDLRSISVTAEGLIVTSGIYLSGNDVFGLLLCFDVDGNLRWSNRYDLGEWSRPTAQYITKDGNIIIAGSLSSFDSTHTIHLHGFIMKTNAIGEPQWCKTTDVQGAVHTDYHLLCEGNDSSLLFCGQAITPNPSSKGLMTLLQTTAGGVLEHQVAYVPEISVGMHSLITLTDGSYIIAGESVTAEGTILPFATGFITPTLLNWSYLYDGSVSEALLSIAQQSADTVIGVCMNQGGDDNKVHLLSLSRLGEIHVAASMTSIHSFNGMCATLPSLPVTLITLLQSATTETPFGISMATISGSLGGCNIFSGSISSRPLALYDTTLTFIYEPIHPISDTVILTLTPIQFTQHVVCDEQAGASKEIQNQPIVIFPNPVLPYLTSTINVSPVQQTSFILTLRDLTGREVYRTSREQATSGEQLQIPTAGFASGVYTVELIDASSFTNIWRGKVVVE